MLSKSARRSSLLGVAGIALTFTAVTACSSGSSFKEPSQQTMQSALLTASDVGSPYTAQSSSGSDNTKPSGCADLDNNLSNTAAGTVNVEADFSAGNNGPAVSEQLVTEPEAQFNSDLARTTNGLKTCHSVTLSESGQSLTLTLSPATGFPSGATADELSTTVQGVQISGDLAEQRIGDAVMLYSRSSRWAAAARR